MKETWKNVTMEKFNFYEVSSFGRVRNGKKLLSPSLTKGYPTVTLCNKGYRRTIRIYKLVALAFIDNLAKLPCVNHKDGNKLNTHVDNLEWCTYGQNEKHAWKHGLIVFTENMKKAVTKTILAEVEKQKRRVHCFIGGRIVGTYESASEAARQIHGSQAHISDCCNGKRFTHKGFSWAWA